jgi:hypothetical protein
MAWSQYRTNFSSTIFGIGLGTFYATSATQFGVPLIIHNTFVWFLIELGPLGFAALLWIWSRVAWNLWSSSRIDDGRQGLAVGLLAAFVGMTVFWMFNEGFYQRHFWLVMAAADRLYSLRSGAELPRAATPQSIAHVRLPWVSA